jgi:GDP-L-fucose synthase
MAERGLSLKTLDTATIQASDAETLRAEIAEYAPDLAINAHIRDSGIGVHKAVPAELFGENVDIDLRCLPACYRAGVGKYVNLLPNCTYPDRIDVPFVEDRLWDGLPEYTVAPYAMTKRIALTQGQAFRDQYGFSSIALIVTATYGRYDTFDARLGQVIPSMICKFDAALREGVNEMVFWGTGRATREFMFVEDAARHVLYAATTYTDVRPLNICTGVETKVSELADMIAAGMGYTGKISWDSSKPEGVIRKCLSRARMDEHLKDLVQTDLATGLARTIAQYREQHAR